MIAQISFFIVPTSYFFARADDDEAAGRGFRNAGPVRRATRRAVDEHTRGDWAPKQVSASHPRMVLRILYSGL